jgi:hypothetical protein
VACQAQPYRAGFCFGGALKNGEKRITRKEAIDLARGILEKAENERWRDEMEIIDLDFESAMNAKLEEFVAMEMDERALMVGSIENSLLSGKPVDNSLAWLMMVSWVALFQERESGPLFGKLWRTITLHFQK